MPPHPGLELVDRLENLISARWDQATRKIANGDPPGLVLSDLESQFADLLRMFYAAAFEAGQQAEGGEPADIEESALIQSLLAFALQRLALFRQQLENELASKLPDEGGIVMTKRRYRAKMYAGEAWKAWNGGKIYGQPMDSLWRWTGPVDENSCSPCREEVRAGKRPLWQILQTGRLPGVGVDCLSRCRHELTRVR